MVVRELITNKSLYNFYTFDKPLAHKYKVPRLSMQHSATACMFKKALRNFQNNKQIQIEHFQSIFKQQLLQHHITAKNIFIH